jgi:hypothetical protein
VVSCLLLLATCSRPVKTDPDVRELLSQMASLLTREPPSLFGG